MRDWSDWKWIDSLSNGYVDKSPNYNREGRIVWRDLIGGVKGTCCEGGGKLVSE
jgi:hypothetical protein